MNTRRFRRNPARHELDDRLDPKVAFATFDVVCDIARFRKIQAAVAQRKRLAPSDNAIFRKFSEPRFRELTKMSDEKACEYLARMEVDTLMLFNDAGPQIAYSENPFYDPETNRRAKEYEYFEYDDDEEAFVRRVAVKINGIGVHGQENPMSQALSLRAIFDEDGTYMDDERLCRLFGLTLWPQGAAGPILVTPSSPYEGKYLDGWFLEQGVPEKRVKAHLGWESTSPSKVRGVVKGAAPGAAPRREELPLPVPAAIAAKAAKRPARTRRVTTATRKRPASKTRAKPRRNPPLRVMEMTVKDLYDLGAGGYVGRDERGNQLRVWDYAAMGQAWLCEERRNGAKDFYVGIGKTPPEGAVGKIRLIPSDRSLVKTPRPRARR